MARGSRKQLIFDWRPALDTVGLKRLLEQAGTDNVIEEIGKKEILARLDVDDVLAHWPAAKRRALKRRLEETGG
jgi:hypothetical protein